MSGNSSLVSDRMTKASYIACRYYSMHFWRHLRDRVRTDVLEDVEEHVWENQETVVIRVFEPVWRQLRDVYVDGSILGRVAQ